jgi:putative transcriptional regulator
MEMVIWQRMAQSLLLGFLVISSAGCAHQAKAGNVEQVAEETPEPPGRPLDKGVFLVATEQLAQSSFRKTVILLTHYSEQGATGLAINRPSDVPLNEAFPDIKAFRHYSGAVFLGGPVQTNAVFALMRTDKPQEGMYRIADDLYFSAGVDALATGLEDTKSELTTRAYAGYSGWAPGQLDAEINRGDWLVVHADVEIIFKQHHEDIWEELFQAWSGQWI